MKQNIRYQTLTKSCTIFEQYYQPQYYTVIANLDCNFEEFLGKALTTNLVTFPNVWIILGDINIAKNEKYYIPLNSLFIFPKIQQNETELITIYRINKNFTEFNEQTIGTWSGNCQLLANFSILRTRINFKGALFRASYVLTHNSTMKHFTDYREKHLDNFTKINYILFSFIADLLNATHIRRIVNTWGWENENDKGVIRFSPGMFQELVYDYADVSGTVAFSSPFRLRYFKFIFAPLKDFAIRFVFRAPPLAYYTNLFVLPFDTMIAIMCQMEFYHEPKSASGKIATFVTLITFTFIYTAFSARIVLLLQSNTNQIDDLNSLYNTNFDFGVEDQVYHKHYFSHPTDRTIEYWRKRVNDNKIKTATGGKFYSAEKGIVMMRDSYFAFGLEQTVASYLIDKSFSSNEKCSLLFVENIYKAFVPYLLMPKNSTYLEFVLVSFRRLTETGLFNGEYRRCFNQKPRCKGKESIFLSVGLIEVYFPFAVFGCGIFMSLALMLLEIFAHNYLKVRCCL
ncbi:unnamed protein product [Ceutorhynchus assimilis]|uniref:Ionotropic receptor n=1 Tax=Ceutorhynchus assimilis TaxID=467358 RepID=A0A9N9MP59_9CUCU|nr:unnamed protein product [Ceutorhynchus assimilis]